LAELSHEVSERPSKTVNALVKQIVSVARQLQIEFCLAKHSEHADHFEVVADISTQVAGMLDQQSFIAVDDARLENQLRSGLADVYLTSIGHLFDQLKQVDFVIRQSRIDVVRANVLYDHLPGR
jgi:hypothetical protein